MLASWLDPILNLPKVVKKEPTVKKKPQKTYKKPYEKSDIDEKNGSVLFLAKAGRYLYLGTDKYGYFNGILTKKRIVKHIKNETYKKMLNLVVKKDPDFSSFKCNVIKGKVELI
jgi:hypothetical protein